MSTRVVMEGSIEFDVVETPAMIAETLERAEGKPCALTLDRTRYQRSQGPVLINPAKFVMACYRADT